MTTNIPLDRDYLFLLHEVAHLMRTRFDRQARARGMTRAQWAILNRVNRTPGLSQNELAAILEVEPITVGRLVDRLETRAFVERRPDPNDRRVWRLHLTPKATPVLKEISDYRNELGALVGAALDKSALDVLTANLLTIKTVLSGEEKLDAKSQAKSAG